MEPGDTSLLHALVQGQVRGGEALTVAQQLLRSLLETSAAPVFLKDRSSTFIGCNEPFAAYAGMRPDEVPGLADTDMPWNGLEGGNYVDWDRQVIESGIAAINIEEPIRRADGSVRILETNKYPLRDGDGTVVGVIGSFRDVTDERAAAARLLRTLRESERTVGEQTAELQRANDALRHEAMERSKRRLELRRQHEEVEVLRNIAASLSSDLDVEAVLDEVVVGIQRLLSVRLVAIALLDEHGEIEIPRLVVEGDEGQEAGLIDFTWMSRLFAPGVRNGASMWSGSTPDTGPAQTRVASAMVVGGEPLGYLVVEGPTEELVADVAADRLGAIAGQTATTISTVRLSSSAAELAALREREILSRELHDSVMQSLWSMSLLSATARDLVDQDHPARPLLERINESSSGSQEEMRSLLLGIRPDALSQLSLRDLLHRAIAKSAARSGVTIVACIDDVDCDREVARALYRIAQEALSNITRHAQATSGFISLTGPTTLTLSVTDDGVGFDTSRESPGHLGLSIMSERAAELDGELTITSARGAGSTVRASVPAFVGSEGAADAVPVPPSPPIAPLIGAVTAPSPTTANGRRSIGWALTAVFLVLLATGALFFARGVTSSAEHANEDRQRVLVQQIRGDIVRPLLDELNVRLATGFGLVDGTVRRRAINATDESLSRAPDDLDPIAAFDGSVGDEARRLLRMLERLDVQPEGAREPLSLYYGAEFMQFEGTIPASVPGTRIDAVTELVYLDQAPLFLFQEALSARQSLNDQLDLTPGVARFLDEGPGSVVEQQGGILGPNPTRPLVDGWLPTEMARTEFAETFDLVDERIVDSALVAEDRWVRSWADTGTLGPPPLSDTELYRQTQSAIRDIRALTDAEIAQLVGQLEAEQADGERSALLASIAGALLAVGALLCAGRAIRLCLRRVRDNRAMAELDPLTGIGGRATLETSTAAQLADRALTHHALVMLDMDRFKMVNDSYGHGFGDRLLRLVGSGLRQISDRAMSRASSVIRLGGDEFVLSLHDRSPIDITALERALEQLRDCVVTTADGELVRPAFSYGIATAHGDPRLADLLEAADLATYEQKAQRAASSMARTVRVTTNHSDLEQH